MNRATQISERARRAGLDPSGDLTGALSSYLDLLAVWNRKINLTALPLEPATDESIDRLIIEPLLAARHVAADDRLMIDIGSGGGSPAVPLRLACPRLELILTEIKSRKAAFLRAVVRELQLDRVEIEDRPFEAVVARPDLSGRVDLVTLRAVRFDSTLTRPVAVVLQPRGRLFRFASGVDASLQRGAADAGWPGWQVAPAPLAPPNVLEIWTRRAT